MVYSLPLLTESMAKRRLVNIEGHIGYVRCVAMEDGSGHNYNVTMLVGERMLTLFIRASL